MNEAFEREKICYEQNFQQARSLNEHLHRIPTLSMTLTGGLWFGVGLKADVDPVFRSALLLFTGIGNLFLILVALKIRDVFQSYLEKISAFHPDSYVKGSPQKPTVKRMGKYTMLMFFLVLMLTAALMSFGGALYIGWPCGWDLRLILLVSELIILSFFAMSINYSYLFDRKLNEGDNSKANMRR